MKSHLIELPISTRDGQFIARYSENGLAELDFPSVGTPRRADRTPQRDVPAKISGWHRMTESALKNILTGNEPENLPPLDPMGTEFQKKVWAALRKISFGQTKSYGEIAEAIGQPKAVRAVGGACGANPIPVLVPCHRVLAAHGKIGGFGGGLDWKRRLLKWEGLGI